MGGLKEERDVPGLEEHHEDPTGPHALLDGGRLADLGQELVDGEDALGQEDQAPGVGVFGIEGE